MASRSSGVMARLTGGRRSEFINGMLTTIFGASRSVMSTMEMVSLPGAAAARLPSASKTIFSIVPDDHQVGQGRVGDQTSAVARTKEQPENKGQRDALWGVAWWPTP